MPFVDNLRASLHPTVIPHAELYFHYPEEETKAQRGYKLAPPRNRSHSEPYLVPIANSLGKTLMLGKIESRRGQWRMRWLDGITDSIDMGLGDGQESLVYCSPWVCKVSDMTE